MFTPVSIKAIEYHLPEKKVTNADLVKEFPFLTEEGIIKRTGIRTRYIRDAANGEIGSDLAFKAAEKLFRSVEGLREKVDFVLNCTQSLDYRAPSTACILHGRLGLSPNCGALDLTLGCSGFLYGLGMAKGLLSTGQAKNVLLLTSDVTTYTIHEKDHELRMLFGDAAAATWVSSDNDGYSVGEFIHGTDGKGYDNLIVKGNALRDLASGDSVILPGDPEKVVYGRLQMNGLEIFSFALRTVPGLINEVLAKSEMNMDDIDYFVFHQPNMFLLKTLRKKLNIPEEKFIISLENTGNTVSCTIPIALQEAKKNNTFKKGDRVLLAAFGIGYSWSASIITVN